MRRRLAAILAVAGLLEGIRQMALLVGAALSRPWLFRRGEAALGTIVVVVPCRDEAHQIGTCVQSLLSQTPPVAGVVVVDDGSSDGSAEAARAAGNGDERLHVVPVSRPSGWAGKPAACLEGASHARRIWAPDWLVFVDADVRLHAAALRSLCGSGERRGVHATSLIGTFVGGDLGVRVLLADVGLAIMTGEGNPRHVNDPSHPAAVASGQCFAIRSGAYWAVGGHAAVSHEILEDCRLADVLQSHGFTHELRIGQGLMQVSMYSSTADLWQGLAKNMAALRGRTSKDVARELWRLLAPTWLPVLALVLDRDGPGGRIARRALEVVWNTRSGMRIVSGGEPELALFAPVSDAVQAGIYLHSVLLWRRGEVSWKGRRLPVPPEESRRVTSAA